MHRIAAITFVVSALMFGLSSAGMADENLHLSISDYDVAVELSETGPLYTVTAKCGTELDANLDDEQLHEKYPSLYDQVKTATAEAQAQVLAARETSSDSSAIPLAITQFSTTE